MLRRLLERPCSLALLVGCQFAFVAYFSLGGFRNLTALFGRSAGPAVDYSRTHDVYANLSRIGSARAAPPDPARPLPFCPERSPFLVTPPPVKERCQPLPRPGRDPTPSPGAEPVGPDPFPCCPGGAVPSLPPGQNRAWKGNPGGLSRMFWGLPGYFGVSPVYFGVSPVYFGVSQAGNSTFNRAKLLNVGVKEALKDEDWDCLFLHDVDLIPENDHNLYTCDPWNPKHVSVAMNKFGYSLPYPQYFGGVSALTPDQYMKINGFPNEYWGWGGEDDDIATRVRLAGMKISRPPISIGHYKMVKHKSDKGNEENPHRY
ncbi:B4GT3 galactosyltransferase, partial [Toxostoma redivivum]|nr:B4GT3 galactosyltransferase [Toxostoma redivivum]